MFLWNCLSILFLYGPGQPQPAAKHNLGLAVGVVGLSARLPTWWQTPSSPRPGWNGPGTQTRCLAPSGPGHSWPRLVGPGSQTRPEFTHATQDHDHGAPQSKRRTVGPTDYDTPQYSFSSYSDTSQSFTITYLTWACSKRRDGCMNEKTPIFKLC
jgi:hypothetical protein